MNITITITSLYNREHNSKRVIDHLNYIFTVYGNTNYNTPVNNIQNFTQTHTLAPTFPVMPIGHNIPVNNIQNFTQTSTFAPIVPGMPIGYNTSDNLQNFTQTPTFTPIVPVMPLHQNFTPILPVTEIRHRHIAESV
jgi:hypothetical protein